MTTPISCSMSRTVIPHSLIDIDDEPGHILGLFEVHARHGFIQEQDFRIEAQRPGHFHPLLESVGKCSDGFFPDMFDLEEVDDILHPFAVLDLFLQAGAEIEQ